MFLARVLPGAARAGCFFKQKRKKLTEANFADLKTKIKK
jgi:hypothetical protein